MKVRDIPAENSVVPTPTKTAKKTSVRKVTAAKKTAAKKTTARPTAAKKTPAKPASPAKRAAATKVSAAKKPVAKKRVVKSRALGTVVATSTPVVTKVAAKKRRVATTRPNVKVDLVVPTQRTATPAPVATPKPRRRRPIVALAKRSDGRPVSFAERVEERMHRELKHLGPVCHRCRINGSRLAALSAAVPVTA